jgi:DNA-binding GntR family transcriptional regulator
MGLGENDKILVIERFTKINNEPMDLVVSCFPNNIFKEIDNKIILENSFTKIVTEIFNLKILKREILIEADIPNNRISKLLQIKESDKKVIQHMTTNWITKYKSKEMTIHHSAFFHRSKGRFFFVF